MGMIQTQQTCPDCRGEGEIIKEKCSHCKGRKVIKESKLVKIMLDKGAPDGKRYVLSGESDEIPGCEPGDVVIEIEIENHKKFIRKGADLIYKCDITLLEALTGFNIVITHLDGRKILIKTKPGEIIRPGILKTVSDCGMPFYESPVRFGNLYLDFNIVFPKNLSEEQRIELKNLFPMGNTSIKGENEINEKYPMTDYKESEANQFATGKEDEREDNEESGGTQQVRCENQ
jgi:DnaJ family protein A protein 2